MRVLSRRLRIYDIYIILLQIIKMAIYIPAEIYLLFWLCMRCYFFAYVQFLKHDIKIHIEKHGSFAEKKKQKKNRQTKSQSS